MDKRHLVFISSTFNDLKEERMEVMRTLLELDCIPTGMEVFPASDETAWELIERVINGCDYYILILGGRYGSVDGDGIGFTEKEYDHAIAQGIPVLGFVHEDPEQLEGRKIERSEEGQVKFEEFREKVKKKHCKMWTSGRELSGQVALAMVNARKSRPRTGWVRADRATSPEKLNELRSRIDELQCQLEDARARPQVDIDGLANGSEVFAFRVSCRNMEGSSSVKMTWDEILRVIGGELLFGETSDAGLHRVLTEFIFSRTGVFGDVYTEDMRTIKAQMVALGLMKTASRDLSAGICHWALTPYGEMQAMRVLALRTTRPGSDDLSSRPES